MGRQINVYDGPLSPEDYHYLKVRENQFAISENERLYGKVGDGWTEEQWNDVNKMLNPLSTQQPSENWDVAAREQEPEVQVAENEDVLFVRSLSYEQVQQQIKERESLDELPQGRDEDLRNRLYNLILEQRQDEELED